MLAGLAVPAGASAATTIKWDKALAVEKPTAGGISAVSCPSATLCVAVDQSGRVLVSKTPTKGAKSWKFAKIDKLAPLTAVSCPTVTLCVAVDGAGDETHTTQPTKGGKFWSKPAKIDPTLAAGGGNVGLAGISCPTTKLCVAVDTAVNGSVVTTTAPTGSAKGWTVTPLGTGVTLDTVSCTSATFCMAAGAQHYYATAPTGGASAWKANGLLEPTGYSVISSIDCPSTTLCLGVGYGNSSTGLATASLTPTAAASSWKNTAIASSPPAAGGGVVDGISCASTSFCVAVDSGDNAYTTTTPSGATTTSTGAVTANVRASVAATTKTTVTTTTTPTTKTTVTTATTPTTKTTSTTATTKTTATTTTPTTTTTPATSTSTTPSTTTTTPVIVAPWATATVLNKKSAGYWSAISCNTKICVVVDGSGFEITGRIL